MNASAGFGERLKAWLRAKRVWGRIELIIYRLDTESISAPSEDRMVLRDSQDAINAFDQSERWLSKQAFKDMCAQRLNSGEHLYAQLHDGILGSFSWVVLNQDSAWLSQAAQRYKYRSPNCVIYGAYSHPVARGKGSYRRILEQIVRDAITVYKVPNVYGVVEVNNPAPRHTLSKLGFVEEARVSTRFVLGRAFGSQAPAAQE